MSRKSRMIIVTVVFLCLDLLLFTCVKSPHILPGLEPPKPKNAKNNSRTIVSPSSINNWSIPISNPKGTKDSLVHRSTTPIPTLNGSMDSQLIHKVKPTTQLPLRMYAEPVGNKEILAAFTGMINCSRSSRVLFSFQYLNVTITCLKSKAIQCQKWYWDVANGTIIYSNQTIQSRYQSSGAVELCAYPVLKGERVQKIVFANGSTQYPGCIWRKSPCASYLPHYDNKLRLRINNSPCCRKLMLDNAYEVASLFDQHNISLVVIGGGVIGWARDKDFVPYDFDVDLAMDSRHRSMIPTMQKLLNHTGIVLKYVHQNTRLWACKRDDCQYSSGIWFIDSRDSSKSVKFDGTVHPFEDIFPFQRGSLAGRQFFFPHNPSNYLNSVYGKGKWEKRMYCNVLASNDNCIA